MPRKKSKNIKNITIEIKKKIIAKREGGVRVSDLAKEFDLAKSTICTILKNKDILKEADVSKGVTRLTNQRPQVLQEVEKLLLVWINENGLKGSSLTGAVICTKALEIYQYLLAKGPSKSNSEVEEFKASRGWFEKFCRRAGINRIRHGETTGSDQMTSEKYMEDFEGKGEQLESRGTEFEKEDGAQSEASATWRKKEELATLPAIAARAEGGDEASFQLPEMSIDSKLLIKQVQERPALWNRYDNRYCQKQVVAALWAEIAAFHGVHELRVKSKWKALRDTFRQELKKSSQPTMWSFYHDMSFLKGHLKTLQGKELDDPVKIESEDGEEDEEKRETIIDIKTEPEDNSIFLEEYNEEVESMGFGGEEEQKPVDDLENRKPEETPESDDDYHFLMSFLPEMKRLSPKKKMMLRIKMMALFYNEIYRE